MGAALGIIGYRDIAHIPTGHRTEPYIPQVGFHGRLAAIQNAGNDQCCHAALADAFTAEHRLGLDVHGIRCTVPVPAGGIAGVRCVAVSGQGQLIAAIFGVSIHRKGSGIPLHHNTAGRIFQRKGRALRPVRQNQLRGSFRHFAQLLHRQGAGLFKRAVQHIAQHRHTPVIADRFQFRIAQSGVLRGKFVIARHSVHGVPGTAQQHRQHNHHHNQPQQELFHGVPFPWHSRKIEIQSDFIVTAVIFLIFSSALWFI